jgi:hypothetical protein
VQVEAKDLGKDRIMARGKRKGGGGGRGGLTNARKVFPGRKMTQAGRTGAMIAGMTARARTRATGGNARQANAMGKAAGRLTAANYPAG